MGTISINGNTYSGRNIVINNGKVIVDGKDVTPDHKEINIQVNGNIDELKVDSCNKLSVTGDVGYIKTQSGDVGITGEVKYNVQTMSGDINCGNIGGSVSTMSGDINYKK